MPDNNGTIDAAVQDGNGGNGESLWDVVAPVLKAAATPTSVYRLMGEQLNRTGANIPTRFVVYATAIGFEAVRIAAYLGLAYSLYESVANR